MMLRSFLAATAIIAALSVSTATAQTTDQTQEQTDQTISGDRIVRSVTMEDVREITASFGHTVIQDMPERNGAVLQTPNGFKYMILLKVCNETTACEGVLIGSIHDVPEGTTWQILNQADMQMDAFGLYIANDQLIVDRYMILSGGVRVESFAHEIGTLVAAAPVLVQSIGQLASNAAG